MTDHIPVEAVLLAKLLSYFSLAYFFLVPAAHTTLDKYSQAKLTIESPKPAQKMAMAEMMLLKPMGLPLPLMMHSETKTKIITIK